MLDNRNTTLMMDEYELTMASAYHADPRMRNRKAAFSVFFRRVPDNGAYAVLAGVEQAIRYLENMRFDAEDIAYLRSQDKYSDEFLDWLADFRFDGDVTFVPEGTTVYPNTPLMTVVATLPAAQLAETAILAQINHQSLIATKTTRIVRSADGRPVSDFGARRAHNVDAAVYGARAAYLAGAASTATVLAGQKFGIPIGGTMAHSWVMAYGDELEAFRIFAHAYPHCATLLVDTYDVVEGCRKAIQVFDEMKAEMGDDFGPYGIRIDSGDLARLSRVVRSMLDSAGHVDAKIVLSNSLDEFTIKSLLAQHAEVDAFGVGERLITASSEPVFGAVYKLVAIEGDDGTMQPRIKVSENVEKITNPNVTHLWRATLEDDPNTCVDIVSDDVPNAEGGRIRVVDPKRPWRILHVTAESLESLDVCVHVGRHPVKLPDLQTVRLRCLECVNALPEGERRLENPQEHRVCMTPEYYERKMELLREHQA